MYVRSWGEKEFQLKNVKRNLFTFFPPFLSTYRRRPASLHRTSSMQSKRIPFQKPLNCSSSNPVLNCNYVYVPVPCDAHLRSMLRQPLAISSPTAMWQFQNCSLNLKYAKAIVWQTLITVRHKLSNQPGRLKSIKYFLLLHFFNNVYQIWKQRNKKL